MEEHTFGGKGVGAVEKFTASLKAFIQHVGATYKHGADIQSEIRKMQPFDMTKFVPDEPLLYEKDGVTVTTDKAAGTTRRFDEETYKRKCKNYYEREETLASNQAKAKAQIDMQIDPDFRQRLEAQQNWLAYLEDGTLIEVISLMRDLTFDVESKNTAHSHCGS